MADAAKTGGPAAKPGAPKKKIRKGVTKGIAHVHATFNNTIITITDLGGAVTFFAMMAWAGQHHS